MIESQNVQIDGQPISIQGGNSTAVKVDGSAVTQPVSGTVTANAGTGTMLVDGSAHTQPVSGTVAVSSVSGAVAVTQSTSPWVVSGTVTTSAPASSSSTVTQITSTAANQTLLASNASRKKAILFFESGIWDVKFGATASTSSKTYHISSANTTLEVDIWTGIIDAICTTSGKLVDVTELV